jgi:hypothetical protein
MILNLHWQHNDCAFHNSIQFKENNIQCISLLPYPYAYVARFTMIVR